MRRVYLLFVAIFAVFATQAQILTPIKWEIKLTDPESAVKELILKATMDDGWHVYDMNLPEGGPVCWC